MSLRSYANAPATELTASCTAVATNIQVASTTGYPITFPYILILERGTANEEVVLVTAASGTTLTVTRGYDSTTAFAHGIAATVAHGISAIDAREANGHVNADSGVHGVTGALLGASHAGTATGVHGVAGAVVGTTDIQTVTNKDLSSATNTLPTPPYARVATTVAQAAFFNDTTAAVQFGTTAEETSVGFGDPANDRLVIPEDGLYLVSLYLVWDAVGSDDRFGRVWFTAGSEERNDVDSWSPWGSTGPQQGVSDVVRLTAGDFVTANARWGATSGGGSAGIISATLSALKVGP